MENKIAAKPYKSVVPVSNNKPYITAVVIMAFAAIAGVVTVQVLRPELDNTNIIIEIFGFATAITTGIISTMKSQETHVAVNHRLDEWMEKSEALALARGIEEGAVQANARTDMLAAQATSTDIADIKTVVEKTLTDTGKLRKLAEAEAKKTKS
jgi:hypothetical protein